VILAALPAIGFERAVVSMVAVAATVFRLAYRFFDQGAGSADPF
jgi:hypothetical protein